MPVIMPGGLAVKVPVNLRFEFIDPRDARRRVHNHG